MLHSRGKYYDGTPSQRSPGDSPEDLFRVMSLVCSHMRGQHIATDQRENVADQPVDGGLVAIGVGSRRNGGEAVRRQASEPPDLD